MKYAFKDKHCFFQGLEKAFSSNSKEIKNTSQNMEMAIIRHFNYCFITQLKNPRK